MVKKISLSKLKKEQDKALSALEGARIRLEELRVSFAESTGKANSMEARSGLAAASGEDISTLATDIAHARREAAIAAEAIEVQKGIRDKLELNSKVIAREMSIATIKNKQLESAKLFAEAQPHFDKLDECIEKINALYPECDQARKDGYYNDAEVNKEVGRMGDLNMASMRMQEVRINADVLQRSKSAFNGRLAGLKKAGIL